MPIDTNRPYQDLPPLPPKKDIETKAVLKKVITASRALSRLSGAMNLIPDPTVLINSIPLLEAQASSEIENIVTTNDELFRAAHITEAESSPATKEALRYRTALAEGSAVIAARPITTSLAQRVCSILNGYEVSVRTLPGTYIGDGRTKKRIYTPPEGKEVISKHLKNWEQFINAENDLDPLIVMALMHYQFEAIHPFPDGNGRTGRVLNVLYLVEKGLIGLPVIYLSGYIVKHKNDYYRLLLNVTQKDAWEEWILFLLDAVETTASSTTTLVEDIRELHDSTIELLLAHKFQRARDLAELLYRRPYVRYSDLMETLAISRQTATKWMNQLEELNLVEKTRQGRNQLFINRPFLDRLFDAS